MFKPTAWVIVLLCAAAGYGAMEIRQGKLSGGFPDHVSPTNTVVRVYDVHRILTRLAQQQEEQARDLPPRPSQNQSEIVQGTWQASSTDPDDGDVDESEWLTETISKSVLPTSWRNSGGQIGTMRYVAGMLIVEQSADGQAKVERFLRMLEGVK
jgi:hypothetical protein